MFYPFSKKIVIFFLLVGFSVKLLAQPPLDFQIHYIHLDEDEEETGNSTEVSVKRDGIISVYTELFDQETQKIYKLRLIEFDENNQILNSYEKDLKKKSFSWNQYLPEKSIFHLQKKGKNKQEVIEKKIYSFESIVYYIRNKVITNQLQEEQLEIYIPHTPVVDEVKMKITCQEKEYQKRPAIECIVTPNSRTLRFSLGARAKVKIIFQKQEPNLLLELDLGEDRYPVEKYGGVEELDWFQRIDELKTEIEQVFSE